MSDFRTRYNDEGRGGNPDAAVSSNALDLVAMVAGKQVSPNAVMLSRHVELTPVGLVLRGENVELSADEIERVGRKLRAIESGVQFAIGDWLNAAKRVWGETYLDVAESLGYELATLYDYKYVADNVEFSVRTEKLTFGHHKIVAPLEQDDQVLWLDKAVAEDWSVARLRRELDAPSEPAPHVPVFLRFIAIVDKWRDRLAKVPAEDRQDLAKALRQMADELEAKSQ